MSAIASSYKMTEGQLSERLGMLDRNEHKNFWEFMRSCQVGTLPYSGYVLGALIPFVQSKGIQFPSARNNPLLSDSQRKQLGIVACGKAGDYQNVANGLAGLQVTDVELRKYYAELYGHDWDEAPATMRQGFAFILQGIESLKSRDELLIFSVL